MAIGKFQEIDVKLALKSSKEIICLHFHRRDFQTNNKTFLVRKKTGAKMIHT